MPHRVFLFDILGIFGPNVKTIRQIPIPYKFIQIWNTRVKPKSDFFASIEGADHLKFPASACRKKKIACSTNVIEKNSCTAVRKKINVAKLFHHSGGLYKSQQNCNHSLPLLPFNSGLYIFGDAAELLLYMCNVLLAYHKQ